VDRVRDKSHEHEVSRRRESADQTVQRCRSQTDKAMTRKVPRLEDGLADVVPARIAFLKKAIFHAPH